LPSLGLQKGRIDAVLDSVAKGRTSPSEGADAIAANVDNLTILARHIARDARIDVLERLEAVYKDLLARYAIEPNGATALAVARFQKDIGFLLKYKPYAVKCASPLGYSIFLQNQGAGFSFQRHRVHKVEVFHILATKSGAYVFLCSFRDWERNYEPHAFTEWLNGRPDKRYDRFRYRPRPGDVIAIDQLNIVHAILGCVVEEFATASTDMVDRLHNQNSRSRIPSGFDRAFAISHLSALEYPRESRVVTGLAQGLRALQHSRPVPRIQASGGSVRVLSEDFLGARHYDISPGLSGAVTVDHARITSVFVSTGRGAISVGDHDDVAGDNPGVDIDVAAGNVLTILPGSHYRARAHPGFALGYSTHQIAPEVALSPPGEALAS
jgi:hypothetical protein